MGSYRTWLSIIKRCHNENQSAYKYYGERGIYICSRWLKFEAFLEDMGHRPPNSVIHRVDPKGPYSPENCVWVSKKAHGTVDKWTRNEEKTKPLQQRKETQADIAKRLGITRQALFLRMKHWSKERAIKEKKYSKDYAKLEETMNAVRDILEEKEVDALEPRDGIHSSSGGTLRLADLGSIGPIPSPGRPSTED